jgi:hypothetical protein
MIYYILLVAALLFIGALLRGWYLCAKDDTTEEDSL